MTLSASPEFGRLKLDIWQVLEAEVTRARRIIEELRKAESQGKGAASLDGKMIDVAMANAARRVLDEAAARLKELGYPFLYYENTDGGHAASANQTERAKKLLGL